MGDSITRRAAMVGVGGLALAGVNSFATAAEETPTIPADPLERLIQGNQRFVAGKTRHAHEGADWRKQLVGGQQPFATILGCSDSRVPIELVFDQGFGDLFVVRVAGNVISPDVVGSIEYAAAHLKTSLMVVLGHQGCGAVTAALQALTAPAQELPGVTSLVKLIEPGLPVALPKGTMEERVEKAVEANVRWSLKQLRALPEAQPALKENRIRMVGAVYELSTGKVRFLT